LIGNLIRLDTLHFSVDRLVEQGGGAGWRPCRSGIMHHSFRDSASLVAYGKTLRLDLGVSKAMLSRVLSVSPQRRMPSPSSLLSCVLTPWRKSRSGLRFLSTRNTNGDVLLDLCPFGCFSVRSSPIQRCVGMSQRVRA
jgi:hypothetical protein